MPRMGMSVLVVGILVVAGVASARGSAAFANETIVDGAVGLGSGGNIAALNDLMGSGGSQRQTLGDTVEDCVEAIRRTRQQLNELYAVSFPPTDFVPPGAQEWCECIVADPPTTSPRTNTKESRADWDRAFDRCRTSVLDGSEFNTVDICRGMFDFFTTGMRVYYHSFCGRLCSRFNPPRKEAIDLDIYWEKPMMDLGDACGSECARDAMPGYCNKYALTYGGWESYDGYRFTYTKRIIAVNGETVAYQRPEDYGKDNKRGNAIKICTALQPLLGCANACCNYSRGFEALQICCSEDETGRSVFDCANNYGGKNLVYDCIEGITVFDLTFFSRRLRCERLIESYVSSSTYGSAKLYTRNSDGKLMVMFSQSVIDNVNFYSNCNDLESTNFVANCVDASDLTYKGPTVQPLGGPLEPADCGDEPKDPCMGTCGDDQECVVAGNGTAFCVECSAMLKKQNRETDAECCTYDAEKMKCVTALKNTSLGKCKRDERIFVINDEGDRVRVDFKKSTGFACGNPRDFRRNGKGCKVRLNSRGNAVCR